MIDGGVDGMSKREKIVGHIEELIKSGQLKKGDKIPSEYALAELFAVNTKTANLAVSTLVSKGLLKRLSGAAGTIVAKGGFYPQGTLTYLTCLGQYHNFWAKLLKGAQKAALMREYALQYTECEPRDLKSLYAKLADYGIKGLLASSYGIIDDELPFPIVHVDWLPPEGSSCDYVTSDNCFGGHLATEHLLGLNHRDIVFVIETSNFNSPTIMERRDGVVRALEEAGITGAADRIFHSSSNCAATLREIKSKYPRFTGILCDSDSLAIRMMDYFLKNGIRVPEEVSIVGCGGALTRGMPSMKITSVEQFPEDMGFYACNALVDVVEGKRTGTIAEKLPVELFLGDSTKTVR